jgi:hypothetical protein
MNMGLAVRDWKRFVPDIIARTTSFQWRDQSDYC